MYLGYSGGRVRYVGLFFEVEIHGFSLEIVSKNQSGLFSDTSQIIDNTIDEVLP